MSVHVTTRVWPLLLPPLTKLVLLHLAGHAEHDGSNAYPSVASMAAECGISERTVQRTLRDLEQRRLIVRQRPHDPGNYRPTVYAVHPEHGEQLPPRTHQRGVPVAPLCPGEDAPDPPKVIHRGDTPSPLRGDRRGGRGDTGGRGEVTDAAAEVTPVVERGDSGGTRSVLDPSNRSVLRSVHCSSTIAAAAMWKTEVGARQELTARQADQLEVIAAKAATGDPGLMAAMVRHVADKSARNPFGLLLRCWADHTAGRDWRAPPGQRTRDAPRGDLAGKYTHRVHR